MADTYSLFFIIIIKKYINYECTGVFSIDLELVLSYPRAIQPLAVQERHPEMLLATLEN